MINSVTEGWSMCKNSRGDANLMKILLYHTLNIIQNENNVKMLIILKYDWGKFYKYNTSNKEYLFY